MESKSCDLKFVCFYDSSMGDAKLKKSKRWLHGNPESEFISGKSVVWMQILVWSVKVKALHGEYPEEPQKKLPILLWKPWLLE